MAYYDEQKLRQSFFLGIILFLGVLLFIELKSFLPATLGAFTFYVLMNGWMKRLVARKWPPALAAATLMFFSLLLIVVPIGALVKMLISRLSISEAQLNVAIQAIQVSVHQLEDRIGIQLMNKEYASKLSGLVAGQVPTVLGATFNTVSTIGIMYFILYFMLTQGREMERLAGALMPMKRGYRHLVQKEMNTLVVSNAIGIPLIALAQGIMALIGYLILGVKEPMLWFSITCITAMIPIVGAALAYVPLAIIFFVNGDTVRGISMLVLGFGIIGTIDNVLRFWLQKKIGDVHPLITVFGVVVGLQLFGFIGLVFGPLLISLFILLIKIYRLEFSAGSA